MHTYQIAFQEFDQSTNSFDNEVMEFEADDQMHAINQLLDFYRTLIERVAVIESIKMK